MEERKTPRMHKYGVSKTTRIMLATVRHVTAWAGRTKVAWFLLNRAYIQLRSVPSHYTNEICRVLHKVNFFLHTAWGSAGIVAVFIIVGTWRKWSASRNGHFTPGTHCVGGWVIPKAGLNSLGNRITPCYSRELNHDFSVMANEKRELNTRA